MVASHAIYRERNSHGMRRISGTKKRQLNAAFFAEPNNCQANGIAMCGAAGWLLDEPGAAALHAGTISRSWS
ncbi:hypothetical protein F3J17_13650 [Burkholderia sp. Ax-1719]|nr:hypothetical protein [Burkholderia sp. Ax-1719]